MRRGVGLAAAALVFGAVAMPAAAQDRPLPPRDAAQRDTLENRLRQRMATMLRNQLGMNDEQIRRFQATNRRFEAQRVGLFNQEREVRGELRQLIEGGDTTQYQRIGTLLDRTIQLQRQRIDLQEAEQKELATFLNPSQRARLYGIEEQLRRRMDSLREGPPGGGRMEPPPMRPGARPGGAGMRRPPPV
jgi:Spy/CpxP family protein refolding chaperone